jgi:hypothetical protein
MLSWYFQGKTEYSFECKMIYSVCLDKNIAWPLLWRAYCISTKFKMADISFLSIKIFVEVLYSLKSSFKWENKNYIAISLYTSPAIYLRFLYFSLFVIAQFIKSKPYFNIIVSVSDWSLHIYIWAEWEWLYIKQHIKRDLNKLSQSSMILRSKNSFMHD